MTRKSEPLVTEALDVDAADLARLFGPLDAKRKDLEAHYGVSLVSRGGQLLVRGQREDIERALDEIRRRIETGEERLPDTEYPQDEEHPRDNDASDREEAPMRAHGHPPTGSPAGPVILHTNNRTPVSPRSRGQRQYCEAIERDDIVFGIGPAGTGKTYLAVANAVAALKRREVSRLILTRPAVEAGESLGFLPGDLKEKVDPYLRPLYDALYEMIAPDKLKHHMENRVIEIVPLAFMRGRTLNNAFVILDEAQNTTSRQMKMFLTRLGADSKTVITGDITQTDLPGSVTSGLMDAQETLAGIRGISFVKLSERDVVRHRLVQLIIRAYDRSEQRTARGEEQKALPANPSTDASENTPVQQ